MFNITPIVKNLLIINILLFAVPVLLDMLLLPGSVSPVYTYTFAAHKTFGLHQFSSGEFSVYQLVTHAFMHSDSAHLILNMLGLFIFGPILEDLLGARRFLIFYAVTAVGSGIIFNGYAYWQARPMLEAINLFLQQPEPGSFAQILSYDPLLYEDYLPLIDAFAKNPDNVGYIEQATEGVLKVKAWLVDYRPLIGASGAIFGILIGCGYLRPNTQMVLLFPPIPVQLKFLVGFYALVSLYKGLVNNPGDNVAHFAHLGGMICGFLLLRFWKMKPGFY